MLRLFALNQANDGYYLIGSEQDWRNFASLIQTTPTANARMTADISVTTMVGSSDKPFSGIFNGDYHTLTVNISGSGEKTAPFCYVKEENGVTAVIRRLKVTTEDSSAIVAVRCISRDAHSRAKCSLPQVLTNAAAS